MDPRPATTEPLAAAEAELAALESVSAEDQLGSYSRIHAALASALAGSTAENPEPDRTSGQATSGRATSGQAASGPVTAGPAPAGRPLGH